MTCGNSPTSAHHWLFNPQGSEHPFHAKCKYCSEWRAFNHPSIYDMARLPKSASAIHRIVIKTKGTLVDPYTGEG